MAKSIVRDPEGIETEYVRRLLPLAGAHVIEIGAGDGRLSWRYGDLTQSVIGIDVARGALLQAADAAERHPGVRFSPVQALAEDLPFAAGSFDIALLAWSL